MSAATIATIAAVSASNAAVAAARERASSACHKKYTGSDCDEYCLNHNILSSVKKDFWTNNNTYQVYNECINKQLPNVTENEMSGSGLLVGGLCILFIIGLSVIIYKVNN